MLSQKTYKLSTVFLLLIFISYVAWSKMANHTENAEADSELKAPDIGASAPVAVRTATAERKDLIIRVMANGQTRAAKQLIVTAQVPGRVAKVLVREGQEVRQGDTLFVLYDMDYRLQLRVAEEELTKATIEYGEQLGERQNAIVKETGKNLLNLQAARKAYERAKKDSAGGKISKKDLQLVEREWVAAKIFHEKSKKTLIASRSGLSRALINVEKARLDLDRTTVTARFAGVIGNLKIRPGMQINAGTECLTLVNLDRLLIDIEILESEIAQVKPGRKAVARFTAFPDEVFAGKVISVNPLMDSEKKTRRATLAVSNPQHQLIPGMYASVKLDAQIYKHRFLVPREAVVLRDQRPVVFIARKDPDGKLRAKWSYVDIGLQNENYVEILSSKFNLREGEQVVISNHYTMIHDALIKIVE